MPVFTQSAPEHDVVLVADESEVFGAYVPYRTWDARPVAGTAGLRADELVAGARAMGRDPAPEPVREGSEASDDATRIINAWTAVRMIGEAATRAQSSDAGKIADFIRSPAFELAAFKGQKLTLRDWDLQLRQPVLLADGRTVVSVSPQEGFLHQFSELDTLGYDRPESQCRLGG